MFSGYVNGLPREPEVPNGPYNRHVHTAFERGRDAAKELGSKLVEPEHLALALLSVKAGSASRRPAASFWVCPFRGCICRGVPRGSAASSWLLYR
jgi:hypothetical protein